MSWEMCHERGQDAFFADDRVHCMDMILAHHATPQGEFGCAPAKLRCTTQLRVRLLSRLLVTIHYLLDMALDQLILFGSLEG